MMLTQSGRSASTLHDNQELHPTDLSPRSSVSSVRSDSQTSSPSPGSSKGSTNILDTASTNMLGTASTNMLGTQLLQALNGHHTANQHHFPVNDLSPLQRLQFAFERTSILSNLFPAKEHEPLSPPQRSSPNLRSPNTQDDMEEEVTRVTPPGSPNSDPANIFQCPLCSLVCNGRHSFNEHLVTHTQQHACPKCDYLTTSEEKLRDHLIQEHDLTDPAQAMDEEDASVPKLNAQGKVKTFKCKQCDHRSMTKSESWTHSATHIRPEKMLKCPKCQFVTEYKHHLEYHLRIHVGSKPYQCSVCSYTCVNKSMLNSHLKSHSAVYQYNCLDCDYQTKYCHSLKMHLRKLNHRPSMVLNPDGTPNPLPIIDVYGTRRGPKMKKPQPIVTLATKSQSQPSKHGFVPSPANSSQSNHSYSSHDSMDNGHMTSSVKYDNVTSNVKYDVTPAVKFDHVTPTVKLPQRELPPISKSKKRKPKNVVNAMPSPQQFQRPESHDSAENDQSGYRDFHGGKFEVKTENFGKTENFVKTGPIELTKNPLEMYAVALNQYLLSNPLLFASGGPEHFVRMAKEQEKMAQMIQNSNSIGIPQRPDFAQHKMLEHHIFPTQEPNPDQMALDLRHPKVDAERRRRKGKAHRYERQVFEDDADSDGEMALDFSNNNNTYKLHGQKQLLCKFCEIAFPDQILYQMHMSYHSQESDPFVCKKCGKRTQDKISFCLHLNTDSHSN